MNISVLAHRFQPVVQLIVIVAAIAGVASYFTLPAREDPEVTIRQAVVTTAHPGLPAQDVERLITQRLEEAIIALPELKEVRSTSLDGLSIIHAQAEDQYFQLDQIWDELGEQVAEAAGDLPPGTGEPVVNDDFGDVAVITLALTGADYTLPEVNDYAEHVRQRLLQVPGTRKIDLVGVQPERIYIEFETARLTETGITPGLVARTLQEANALGSGGRLDTGDIAFTLQQTGRFESAEDVADLLIRPPGGDGLVRLGDIAEVRRSVVDPAPRAAFYNGDQAVVLAVNMQPDESVINYSRRAADAIDEVAATLPEGMNLDITTFQSEQVQNAVYGVSVSVLQTLAIVLGVVILFLGVRTGLIVGSIVPGVMLATLAVMGVFNMQLERMSLATLVIALGLLVDNGIVIAEDFKRRLEEHGDRDRALRETGGELALPLLSSSATTVLVFIPLMLAQHSAGEYTRNISLVILIALSVSWLLALMVTPALCHRFMKQPKRRENAGGRQGGFFGRIETVYGGLLRAGLRVRIPTMIVTAFVFAGSVIAMQNVPQRFFPQSDRTQILVYATLPAGVTTRTTEDRIQAMSEIVTNEERYPGLGDVVAYSGFGGPRFVLSLTPLDPAPNVGFMVINAADLDAVLDAIPRLRRDFAEQLPDVDARVTRMFVGPTDPNVIQIQVKGPDKDYVFEQADELVRILASVDGTIDVWSDWYNRTTRLDIDVDQAAARRAGVSSRDVADALQTLIDGRIIGRFEADDEVTPISVRLSEDDRNSADRLATLPVFPAAGGAPVPLSQVADIVPVADFSRIQREDMVPTVTVEARHPTISPEDMAPMIAGDLEALNEELEPGHRAEFDGIVMDSQDGRAALAANFPLAFGAIIILLVAQFNSYRRPLIILLTIPLVLTGAVIGLTAARADFGFIPILGLLALAGIIVNNAIVLIDRIDIERSREGQSDWDALITACKRRLRPIVMTTITTIVGLAPLIIAQDVLFYGMASAVAAGLAVGTVLTLGVVPILYALFFNITAPPKEASDES